MKMSGEKAIHRQELERGLLTQKISRLFLKYTIPGVAGLLFLGIQSVIDGVILGRFVGANALASVNLILPCYSLMTALSIVIGVGCQTLIGINLGRLDRQEANNAITTSFLFLGFNPRTHTRCDPIGVSSCKRWAVSIHAPTRGATKTRYKS